MTRSQLIQALLPDFIAAGFDQPLSEVHHLICGITGCSRSDLIAFDEVKVTNEQVKIVTEASQKRRDGYPLAYIVGKKPFYKSEFRVGPGALIPRPETELLVELALDFLQDKNGNYRFMDWGAGTGCIGYSVLLERSNSKLLSIEKSPHAFEYLKQNRDLLVGKLKVSIFCQDVEALEPASKDKDQWDLILANPPYIELNDPDVEWGVRSFEPHEALFSDQKGLGHILSWSKKASSLLRQGGRFIFEFGSQQGLHMRSYDWNSIGLSLIDIKKDYSNKDRIAVVEKF